MNVTNQASVTDGHAVTGSPVGPIKPPRQTQTHTIQRGAPVTAAVVLFARVLAI